MNMRMGVVWLLYQRDHGSALMRVWGKKGRRPEGKLFVSTSDIATGWQRTKTGRVLE